jgi:hypothetical protein
MLNPSSGSQTDDSGGHIRFSLWRRLSSREKLKKDRGARGWKTAPTIQFPQ